MPSPFPGMNPYLEHEVVWTDFHQAFINAARIELNRQVRPNYVVRIDAHVLLHEMPSISLAGRGDLTVLSALPSDTAGESVALMPAPTQVIVPLPVIDEERIPFLEVLDRDGLNVVTVIELVSRSNKYAGPDRAQYIVKRTRILQSPVHFVEIDLLRSGPRLPIERLPDCTYYAMVSRAGQRPGAGLWPVGLRERLPTIPVPLRSPDRDATLDLQALLHQVYDDAGFETYLYRRELQPALSPEDAAWARQFLPAGG